MSNEPTPKWQKEKNAELCAEISGFLFQHPCGMHARYRCHRCEKPTCIAHAVSHGNKTLCESCSKLPPEQPVPPNPYWRETEYWSEIDVDFHDRPIWYRRKGGIRRSSNHRHKSDQLRSDREREIAEDFTDADETGFAIGDANSLAEDSSGWENDMGAS